MISAPVLVPAGIALLIDPAWLLHGYHLTTGSEVQVDGRSGIQVIAELRDKSRAQCNLGSLSSTFLPTDKIEAVIDSNLGVALRQVWYFDDRRLLTQELSNVTENVDPAVFHVDPPPGLKVIHAATPWSSAIKWAAADLGGSASRLTKSITRWLNKHP
jgi:outer membrane lipoprotein-sorting protein